MSICGREERVGRTNDTLSRRWTCFGNSCSPRSSFTSTRGLSIASRDRRGRVRYLPTAYRKHLSCRVSAQPMLTKQRRRKTMILTLLDLSDWQIRPGGLFIAMTALSAYRILDAAAAFCASLSEEEEAAAVRVSADIERKRNDADHGNGDLQCRLRL